MTSILNACRYSPVAPLLSRIILALVISTAAVFSASLHPEMPVGVAQADITPEYPVRLSGFGGRRTESEGVTLKIWAKAIAFADEKSGPAILITADNVCVPDEITSEIARRLGEKIGLKRERLTITATHTHTAPMLKNVCPTLFGVPIPEAHQANIDKYTAEFTDHLEKVALAAYKDIRPARLSWGTGLVTFAANRRTAGGPVDHDLPVLAVHDLEGKVRAVYFSYACHCVTLSDNKISGDWAGFAQKSVQELYPGAIALASVGCGADSNPNSGVTGSNVEVCATQGNEIANEIKRLMKDGLSPITEPPQTRYTRVDLPLDKPRSRAEWEARAKGQDAIGHHARVNLERLDRGEKLPASLNYPIQTWLFGNDLAIVFLPGETVVDYSLRLKREYDRSRLWVNGYSNDGRCYIPSERILKEGGYEGGGAMIYYDVPQQFAPGLEEKIISAVAAQLPATFKAAPGTEGTRPLSPREALRSFRTKPGLEIELVAAEPLVQDPVAIDWGADGKLWVCEMHDYPSGVDQNWQPGGRVKFLVDENNDGRYDKATVFLDKLPFPTGVTAWGKGVLISAAPDIIYAEDTEGDGKADKVERLFTGFFTDNFQARVNSLNLGLDNWIYAANGLLGGTIEPLENTLFFARSEPINIRNHDFRIHPFLGTIELASGLTQQGRVRDDWDNWFGCDNSRLLLNFPVPERYIRRNPHVPAPDPVRHLTSGPDGNRLYPTSRLLERFNDPGHANRVTSAAGLGIYRDTLLGEEFYGNAFTCEPVHNLVHREVVEQDAVFTSHRAPDESSSEFLSSTDNWFRPVQARSGPDGALYIVDMYRFLIEHPRWIPADRLAQIDIRAGADRGRIYRVRKSGVALRPIRDLTELNGPELVAEIDSPNGINRDRVHIRLLLLQDRSAIPQLEKLAANADLPQVRVQALAVLDGLSATQPSLLKTGLQDQDPHVRQHAIRLAEPFLKNDHSQSEEMLSALLPLTNDSSMVVLQQLAFSLGESKSPAAGQALATLAKNWVANLPLRAAILSSSTHHAGEVLKAVMTLDENTPGRAEWISPLIATVVNSPDQSIIAPAVRSILPDPNVAPGSAHLSSLANLLDALDRRKLSLDQLFPSGSPDHQRIVSILTRAGELALDPAAPENIRALAIALLGRGPSGGDITILSEIASGPSDTLRRSALTSLKRQRNPEVARELLGRWSKASPAARADIIGLLLDREEWTLALLKAVEASAIKPHEISLADRQRLNTSGKAEIRSLAAKVLPTQASSGREEIFEKYKPSLALSGAPDRGLEVFAASCAACHQLNGLGQNVGPDLAALRGKDADYWLKNILDPNAVVEPRFVSYDVELKDDRSLSGIIKGETATSLTIVSGSGSSETILRSEIHDIRASSLSLMPEGLEQAISLQQMADLVAFLKSGHEPKKVAGNEPQSIVPTSNRTLMLPATKAEIYGESITFESGLNNIGMWHGQDDHLVWSVQVPEPGAYEVYLDYACAANSGGNPFRLSVADQTLHGVVAVTGPDWSHYKQVRIGQIILPAGNHRLTFRPDGPLRGALIDLRTIALAPPGTKPPWPTPPRPDHDVLRDPPSVARFILDSTRPDAAREAAVHANPQFAGALIKEMTRDLKPGTPDEYARIPWIWRVAIAAGKRNDAGQLKTMLENSLPELGEPLHDWQAVVIGGGIINGLSMRGLWPSDRLEEILSEAPELKKRWDHALELSSKMTDNEQIPAGTRYDALRMIALESWEKRGAQLLRYLKKGTHPELQMGAVSGLADMKARPAATALADALSHLEGHNRELALDALLRDEARASLILDAIEKNVLSLESAGKERLQKIAEFSNYDLQLRAKEFLR